MKHIVQLDKSNHAFTTTLILAEGVGIEHRAVLKLLDTHLKDIEDLESPKTFQMFWDKRKGSAGKPARYAELTELQATFLITLMRNSKIVIQFKKQLSTEFHRMRKRLAKIAANQANEQWLASRKSAKPVRLEETDTIKDFVAYATRQGSKNSGRYYSNITTMENKALFILGEKYTNVRDVLDERDTANLAVADRIVSKALRDGMDSKLHYKEIYRLAKQRVRFFADEGVGVSPLAYLNL